MTGNTARKNIVANSYDDLYNGGTLIFYSGTSPGADNNATGTIICSITLPADAFDEPVAGLISKLGTWSGIILNDGTIGYGRLQSSNGTYRDDITVGASAGAGIDAVVSPGLAVLAGGTLTVISCSVQF